MKRMFLSWTILCLSLLCLKSGFSEQQKLFKPEKHEVTVRLVLVDAIVTDKKGSLVTGLTKDDFVLFEDGKKVTINSLDFIRLKKPPLEDLKMEKGPFIPSRKNYFFVIFDSINTIKRMLDRSRQQILSKLISLIELGQEIMVLELSETEGMKVLQPLTSDRDLIAQSVNRASGSIWIEKSTETLSSPSIITRKDQEKLAREQSTVAAFEDSARDVYEFEARLRFEKTINGVLAVLNMVKGYPGRKPVLLVSGGIPALSFEKLLSGRGVEVAIARSEVSATKVLDPFKVLQKSGPRGGQDIINDLIRYANSHNITFYSLDPDSYLRYILPDMSYDNFPRQIEVAEIKQNELTNLKFLALDTGGETMLGAEKFNSFQEVIDRDFSSYYELSYYPARKKADGRYHKLEVRVNKPGLKIRFRQGYYDYTDDQKEALVFASSSFNPALFEQLKFDAQAVPFIQGKDTCILWLNMALPVRELILKESESLEAKTLKVNLWMEDLEKKDTFSTQINIPFNLTPAFRDKLKNATYFGYNTCSQELKLKRDKYRVIFSLYDESSGKVGTVEQMFEGPGLEKGTEAHIVNSVFGRLIEDKTAGASPYTISQKDGTLRLPQHRFYPMGLNQFSKKEHVSLFVQIFSTQENGVFAPRVSLLQNGEARGDVPAHIVDESWNKKANVRNIMMNLDFQDFPSGEYVLWIKLVDPSSGRELEEKLPIKIL